MSQDEQLIDKLAYLLNCKDDTELARKLGIPRSTVGSWRKRDSIPLRKLRNFCNLHNVNINSLLSNAPVSPSMREREPPSYKQPKDPIELSLRRYREMQNTFERATKEIGYTPSILISEGIKEAMLVHGLEFTGVIAILRMMKADADDKKLNNKTG